MKAVPARSVWGRFDWLSLSLMLVLTGLGLVLIGSVTRGLVPGDATYFVKRQLLWAAAGLIAMAVVVAVPYARWAKWWPWLYGLSLCLLLVVLVKGHAALGAQRWISIGSLQLQPSEFAKLAIIVTLGAHLAGKRSLGGWRDLVSPLLHMGVPLLLILKQPDLGTALVFVAISLVMLMMAGAPAWRLAVLYGGGLALVVGWIYAHLRFHVPIPMHDYQLQRLMIFLHPNQDPLGAGFNVIQARIAVGSGGLFGTGLSLSRHLQLTFLPESYTDFIFAVIGGELGFVGSMAVLALYFLLIVRMVRTLRGCPDRLGRLLAAGVAALFAFHVIESAGMASGVMPVAGVPLPFMSYGGSAFLTDAMALGLAINVRMRAAGALFAARPTPQAGVRPAVVKRGSAHLGA